MSKKRIIIIGTVVTIIFGIGVVLFFGREKGSSTDQGSGGFLSGLFGGGGSGLPTSSDTGQDGSVPSTGDTPPPIPQTARLVQVVTEPVIGATFDSVSNRIKYFKKASGHLFNNTLTGNDEKRLSNVTTLGLLNVVWSDTKNAAILEYFKNGEINRWYAQYKGTSTNSSGIITEDIMGVVPVRESDKFAYISRQGDVNTIITANPDNTSKKTVASTKIVDPVLSWVTKDLVSIQTKASGYAPGFLYVLRPSTGAIDPILSNKEGLTTLWSPNGNYILYTQTSQGGNVLSTRVLRRDTKTEKDLDVVTLPEKCIWSTTKETTIYCAIPRTIPQATLPDGWWQGNIAFNDTLWEIEVNSGTKRVLLENTPFDVIHMFTSKDEAYLFFINKKDETLWSLNTAN